METPLALPLPQLAKGRFPFSERGAAASGAVSAYTDERLFSAVGVRVGFTLRDGGASAAPYDSLNLGTHVKDDPDAVAENRRRVLAAFGVPDAPLLVPNQVHGDTVTVVGPAEAGNLDSVRTRIAQGTDALVVGAAHTAALLCYADCVPLVLVAPHGTFAVVHAGWRGVDNGIAVKALGLLLEADGSSDAAQVNVYRGPYIHRECFETGPEVYDRFVAQFGAVAAYGPDHIDLGACLDAALVRAGVDARRIADVDRCTVCHNDEWFSYRAQGGVCGRHGAFACRMPRTQETASHPSL